MTNTMYSYALSFQKFSQPQLHRPLYANKALDKLSTSSFRAAQYIVHKQSVNKVDAPNGTSFLVEIEIGVNVTEPNVVLK